MDIQNDRDEEDTACLDSDWAGVLIGKDGYPKDIDYNYYIAGSEYASFKAIAIEFYGVKT